MHRPAMSENFRWRRIARLLAIGLALEIGLLLLARMAPAMAALSRSGMIVVAAAFGLAALNAARDRNGRDRRNGDRRTEP